ncbi:MAG: hypothetical protein RL172_737 [Bacteroidota bacterium]
MPGCKQPGIVIYTSGIALCSHIGVALLYSLSLCIKKNAGKRMHKLIPSICWLACIVSSVFYNSATAQDSSHLRISLLTCTPGDELYSTFGHSALRITDTSSRQDIVFNYGTFNFDDPDFYTKFIKGKLQYFVSTAYLSDFIQEYQYNHRDITEQVLQLTAAEKIAIQQYLYNNIKEENKYYQYDFLFNNCTTRLRDIIVSNKTIQPVFSAVVPAGTSFRNAIHQYLEKGNKEWSKLGIDLLLGAPTDAVMTVSQSQFLPDNLLKSLDSSNGQHKLVASSAFLYPSVQKPAASSLFTPLLAFSLLLLFIVALDFSKTSFGTAFLYGFDGLLFFITGATGILLLYMWLGTNHGMCKNNYNLLWASPTHAVAAFFIHSKKKWVKKYLLFTVAGLLLVMGTWMFLPQQLNGAFLAICLLLVYRSLRHYQQA